MRHTRYSSRSPLLTGFQPLIARVDAYLESISGEDEDAKIEVVQRLMFGEPPEFTKFETREEIDAYYAKMGRGPLIWTYDDGRCCYHEATPEELESTNTSNS